jgi:hypothetical protein
MAQAVEHIAFVGDADNIAAQLYHALSARIRRAEIILSTPRETQGTVDGLIK